MKKIESHADFEYEKLRELTPGDSQIRMTVDDNPEVFTVTPGGVLRFKIFLEVEE
jgi:hypothetical protein